MKLYLKLNYSFSMLYYIIIFLTFTSCSQDDSYIKFKAKSFEMDYHKSWKQSKTQNVLIFKSPAKSTKTKFQENFNVIIQNLNADSSLDSFSDETVGLIKNELGQNSIISYNETTLADQKGMEIEYIMPKNIQNRIFVDLRITQKWTVLNDKAYILTYTAENKSNPEFDKVSTRMFNSFKIM